MSISRISYVISTGVMLGVTETVRMRRRALVDEDQAVSFLAKNWRQELLNGYTLAGLLSFVLLLPRAVPEVMSFA